MESLTRLQFSSRTELSGVSEYILCATLCDAIIAPLRAFKLVASRQSRRFPRRAENANGTVRYSPNSPLFFSRGLIPLPREERRTRHFCLSRAVYKRSRRNAVARSLPTRGSCFRGRHASALCCFTKKGACYLSRGRSVPTITRWIFLALRTAKQQIAQLCGGIAPDCANKFRRRERKGPVKLKNKEIDKREGGRDGRVSARPTRN